MHFTMTAAQLSNGLENSAVFISHEKHYPHLSAVHLRVEASGHAIFTTASRTIITRATCQALLEPGTTIEPAQTLLPARSVRELLTVLRKTRNSEDPMTLTAVTGQVSILNPRTGDSIISTALDPEDFPDTDPLWPAPGSITFKGARQLEPHVFARLGRLRSFTAPPTPDVVKLSFGATDRDPVLASYDQWFAALIRPLSQGPGN